MKTLLILTTAALLLAASAQASTASRVITGLTYTPKTIYDDESSVGVIFRANRPARPGYEYGIIMFITGKYAMPGVCSSIAISWDRKFGGDSSRMRSTGKHWKLMKGTRYGYWCRGKANVSVVEHRIGAESFGTLLSSVDFRIAAAP